MKDSGCKSSTVSYYLIIAGALNWGLVGLGQLFGGDWNIVHATFGALDVSFESLVYVIIGGAAVMMLIGCKCAVCTTCRLEMEVHTPKPNAEAPKT